MELLLDEDVGRTIGQKLEGRGIETVRRPKETPDRDVMEYAVEQKIPVLTRNEKHFTALAEEMQHYGVLIDKLMHLRDRTMVADTVAGVLRRHGPLENAVLHLSDFYGRF